jgi:hypothetical protein
MRRACGGDRSNPGAGPGPGRRQRQQEDAAQQGQCPPARRDVAARGVERLHVERRLP